MAIEAEQTGVTEGKAATHSPVWWPRSISELQRRRAARGDDLLEHRRLHRVDDGQDELLAARHGAQRRIRRPAYFSPSPAAPAGQQPHEGADHEERERREEDREARGRDGGALRVDRQRGGGLRVEAAAHAAEELARGLEARARRTAGRRPRPPTTRDERSATEPAAISAPSASATAQQHVEQRRPVGGVGPERRAAKSSATTRTSTASRKGQDSRKLKSVPVEVDAEVGGRQRAGQQDRQERPDADGGCDARRPGGGRGGESMRGGTGPLWLPAAA